MRRPFRQRIAASLHLGAMPEPGGDLAEIRGGLGEVPLPLRRGYALLHQEILDLLMLLPLERTNRDRTSDAVAKGGQDPFDPTDQTRGRVSTDEVPQECILWDGPLNPSVSVVHGRIPPPGGYLVLGNKQCPPLTQRREEIVPARPPGKNRPRRKAGRVLAMTNGGVLSTLLDLAVLSLQLHESDLGAVSDVQDFQIANHRAVANVLDAMLRGTLLKSMVQHLTLVQCDLPGGEGGIKDGAWVSSDLVRDHWREVDPRLRMKPKDSSTAEAGSVCTRDPTISPLRLKPRTGSPPEAGPGDPAAG